MTAVEWLLATLEQNSIIDLDSVDSDTYYTIINEAKQIEKEQLENARPQIISNCVTIKK